MKQLGVGVRSGYALFSPQRTSNVTVEAETKVDVIFLCFEPETFLSMFFRSHERFKCNDSLSLSPFTVVYCFSTVDNDKKIIARPLQTLV